MTSLAIRLTVLVQRTRVVAYRRLARMLLSLSTARARRRLSRTSPIVILLDNSVLAAAVTHETDWISTGPQAWGPFSINSGYLARVPVRRKPTRLAPSAERRDYEDVCYLVSLVHLARLGLVEFKTAGELQIEQWRQPAGRFSGYGYFDHNLFHGIDIAQLDRMPAMSFAPDWMKSPNLTEQQRERLRTTDDALYKAIVKHLGGKHSQDAWHIRTAEKHGAFCFLTTDHSLRRHFSERSKQEPLRSLKTTVLTPAEVGRRLGLRPVDPKFLSYEGEADVPTRPDLSMPGNKRRRYGKRRP